MKTWFPLLFGLTMGGFMGKALQVEEVHACEPSCAPDESVVVQVSAVEGNSEAHEFWVKGGIRDAVLTPHYLLVGVGEGQVELGYDK